MASPAILLSEWLFNGRREFHRTLLFKPCFQQVAIRFGEIFPFKYQFCESD